MISSLGALCAMSALMGAPTHAAPLAHEESCGALNAAQQHSDAAGNEVNHMRTALQAFVIGHHKKDWTDSVTVAVNADVRNLQADETAIDSAAFAGAVNDLAGAVKDMNQSVKGIYRLVKDDDDWVPTVHSDIPSPDTYAFVDTAGDKQAALAGVVNGLRGTGCV
jgi:hypothetical protein